VRGAEICFLEAAELAHIIRARELSAEETMAACLEQIGRTNPRVNAIVTLVPERAMRDARERLVEALARGEDIGPLHGLPVAHKDLAPTRDNQDLRRLQWRRGSGPRLRDGAHRGWERHGWLPAKSRLLLQRRGFQAVPRAWTTCAPRTGTDSWRP
jgi:hypothetical protein